MSSQTCEVKPTDHSRKSVLDYVAKKRWIIPLAFVTLYIIVFSIMYTNIFLSPYNITSLLLEFSIPAIIVIGMAIQLIGGEIDLSVGYNVMFSSMFSSILIVAGVPLILAILITLSVTSLFGLIIGLLVSRVGVNSFIGTLGLGLFYYGLTQFLFSTFYSFKNGAADIRHLPKAFTDLSKLEFLGLQLPVYYAVVLLIVFSVLMSKSRYFRKYYYIGMNKEAAQLSGINVKGMKAMAFVFSSLFASFAGIILVARMGSAAATYGIGWELKVITACVIGGVSMKGGRGAMVGAIIGMLFTTCLSNGMRIADVPSNIYKIAEGLVLLGAVVLDAQMSKRKTVG